MPIVSQEEMTTEKKGKLASIVDELSNVSIGSVSYCSGWTYYTIFLHRRDGSLNYFIGTISFLQVSHLQVHAHERYVAHLSLFQKWSLILLSFNDLRLKHIY